MFPPFDRSWQPVSEQYIVVALAGRSVVLSGRVDLMLGRGQHLLVDFKTGEARRGYAEDMRFYALVVALAFGVAPYRVATVFCESMEWQSEDVTEEVLEREADRVLDVARSAAALASGRQPELIPGPHCRWCPRSRTCPSSAAP
jgi:RecB family exonuclease